ncbi:hypothetical protein Q9233_014110 [Columba guinea]|nr:hypothetical protein Q9233_014110 [Columba guinea]
MATRGLLEMLDAAFRTPRVAVVDLVALHELLKAMIIRQEGQQELSFLEPGQSLTHGLAKDQESKKQPGQEKEEDGALGTGQQPWEPQEQLDGKDTLEGTGSNSGVTSMAKEAMPKTTEDEERDVSKKRASLQDLWEEINKFKEALCGLAEDMRAMQKAHSGMAEDMREMQEAMQKAHSGMAQDIQEMKETLEHHLPHLPLCDFPQQEEGSMATQGTYQLLDTGDASVAFFLVPSDQNGGQQHLGGAQPFCDAGAEL